MGTFKKPSDSDAYRSHDRHTVSFNMKPNSVYVVEYVEDVDVDMFQVGRCTLPHIDMVVTSLANISKTSSLPAHEQERQLHHLEDTVSRYACRILVERTPPHKARIFAAGFDRERNIFLGEKAKKWERRDGQVDGFTTNGVMIRHPRPPLSDYASASAGGGVASPRVPSDAPVCVCDLRNLGLLYSKSSAPATSSSVNCAKSTAVVMTTTSSSSSKTTEEGDVTAAAAAALPPLIKSVVRPHHHQQEEEEKDAPPSSSTSNRCAKCHQEKKVFSKWREISVSGDVYLTRKNRNAAGGGVTATANGIAAEPQEGGGVKPAGSAASSILRLNEANELLDGTLIDLCGVTLMWRSADGLRNSMTSRDLMRMCTQLNTARFQCPVQYNTLVIRPDHPLMLPGSSATPSLQPPQRHSTAAANQIQSALIEEPIGDANLGADWRRGNDSLQEDNDPSRSFNNGNASSPSNSDTPSQRQHRGGGAARRHAKSSAPTAASPLAVASSSSNAPPAAHKPSWLHGLFHRRSSEKRQHTQQNSAGGVRLRDANAGGRRHHHQPPLPTLPAAAQHGTSNGAAASSSCSAYSNPDRRRPFIYMNCGHVHGLHEWVDTAAGGGAANGEKRTCPVCKQQGRYVALVLGQEMAFYVDRPARMHKFDLYCFNPCGHYATEQTVKFWHNTPIPSGFDFNLFRCCPFCGAKCVSEPVRLIFQGDFDEKLLYIDWFKTNKEDGEGEDGMNNDAADVDEDFKDDFEDDCDNDNKNNNNDNNRSKEQLKDCAVREHGGAICVAPPTLPPPHTSAHLVAERQSVFLEDVYQMDLTAAASANQTTTQLKEEPEREGELGEESELVELERSDQHQQQQEFNELEAFSVLQLEEALPASAPTNQ